jgi:hypothetical protein
MLHVNAQFDFEHNRLAGLSLDLFREWDESYRAHEEIVESGRELSVELAILIQFELLAFSLWTAMNEDKGAGDGGAQLVAYTAMQSTGYGSGLRQIVVRAGCEE